MEGVAQAPPRVFLPPLIASLSLVRSAPDFIGLLRREERILRRFESWLVGVERDDVGREEGEGCFPSKTSVSRRLKGSMPARNDCIAEF